MAAALAAEKKGCSVVVFERDKRLGGILNQCIHNGFGLHYFKEELTGPEYAARFAERVKNAPGITVYDEAMVLSVTPERTVTALSPYAGLITVEAGATVLAMGCRERTAGAIALTGTRPVGIYTAGTAQRLINVDGYSVGKEAVILGSGDIGLIMARRMTFEGVRVKLVLELMPYSSGLKRNIVQCLDDFEIPILYGHTITRVEGAERLRRIYYAEVGEDIRPKPETEKYVDCDTLLLSVGLIPENDLINGIGIKMNPLTSGAVADEYRQTSVPGIFAAGNVLHVHDLVDNVSAEAELAGSAAADYAKGVLSHGEACAVKVGAGVRYTVPQTVYRGTGKVDVYFRTDGVYKNKTLKAESGGETVFSKHRLILTPGEMERIEIDKSKLKDSLTLRLE